MKQFIRFFYKIALPLCVLCYFEAHEFWSISASQEALVMAGFVVLAFAVVIVFLLVRILNLTDSARAPKIFAPKHRFVDQVLQSCPILFERYGYKLLFQILFSLR